MALVRGGVVAVESSRWLAWRWALALLLPLFGNAWATEPTVAASTRHLLDNLALKSKAFLIVDEESGETLAAKNADTVVPVASLTKLMTALVVIEARQNPDELIQITSDDIDREKRTPSRLRVGAKLDRADLLLLTLMASENRAALTLGRNYPGGRDAFVAQMNSKALLLGMQDTRFVDPAGLSSRNVSSPRDLHLLMAAANKYPVIREYTTRPDHKVKVGKKTIGFINSNRLVRRAGWTIDLQKTGFTNEAGRCLVMRVKLGERRLAMIFLNSFGKLTRYGDASRVRQGLEKADRKKVKSPATVQAAATEPA